MVRPLDGVRVLDLSRVVSGPFAGRMLSDLGADVVKLEPPEGDLTRIWGAKINGVGGFFQQQNAGKRNICVDLRAPGARELVIDLAAKADIVLENFRGGVMNRLGLGWDVLSAANPRLIMCAISGFGQAGPSSERAAYAPVVQAETGFVLRQAEQDNTVPTDPVLSIADYLSGLHALVAMLAALRLVEKTGAGTFIDLSMADATMATDDYLHHTIDNSELERLGGDYWKAADGTWVLVAARMKGAWHNVSRAHGLVDPSPPGSDLASKLANRRAVFGQWVESFATVGDFTSALEAAGLAWGILRDSKDALSSPWAEARGMVAQVDDRGGGTRGVLQSPYRFSAAESGVRGGAAHRGEHNSVVLQEWLDRSPASIASLVDAGVLLAGIAYT